MIDETSRRVVQTVSNRVMGLPPTRLLVLGAAVFVLRAMGTGVPAIAVFGTIAPTAGHATVPVRAALEGTG